MCPEHTKTHSDLNLTRLPDYAGVRSEIETILEAQQVEFESRRDGHWQAHWAERCM